MKAIADRISYALQLAFVAGVAVSSAPAAVACVEGDLRGEAVVLQREAGPTSAGETTAMNIVGAGWFRVAEIVKAGGSSDQTIVTLELDGVPVITTSFAALKNPWMQLSTSFIVANVRSEGSTSTMTIWYSPELKFQAIAVLRIDVEEEGVDALKMRATMNKPYPHAHLPGQLPAATAALPAFK